MDHEIKTIIQSSSKNILDLQEIVPTIIESIECIVECLKNGKKVVIFGNGGSAADSQHFAAELVGRFLKERESLAAIALTTDTSVLTALGNDYGFEFSFSRQCESLVNKNEVVIAISTSGNSKNIINAVKICKEKKAKIIGITGNSENDLKKESDIILKANSSETPRIQEIHRIILHLICHFVEINFVKN